MTKYTADTHALPYPEGVDKVAVHSDIQALAAKTGIAISTEGARAEEAAATHADAQAESVKTYAESVRWVRGTISGGVDLDSLTTAGLYRLEVGSLASSILNRPPGFSNPFQVEVTPISGPSGIYRQVARMKNVGVGSFVEYTRHSNAGIFYGWENTTPLNRATLTTGADLNVLTTPGFYQVEVGSMATSILNRPVGFNNPFEIEVRLISSPQGIYRQTARMKEVGLPTWREATRWSLNGAFLEWVEKSNGATTGPERDAGMVAIFGDSQSDGSTDTSWPVTAGNYLNGTRIINHARGGDNSNGVLARAGVLQPMFTAEEGSIPASGSVGLRTSQRLQFRTDRLITGGSIAGVAGVLTHVADDKFTFTRSTAGSVVSLSTPKPFTTNISTNAATVIFWFGGNDFNEDVRGQERSVADHVIGAYRRAVVWAEKNGYQPVIAGVTNRLSAVTGSEGFRQVQQINTTLRRAYPDIFLDVQAYYSERAIYDAGLTPTAGDLTSMSRGEIPPQLFVDGIHLLPVAHQAIGRQWIAPWLAAKGFAFTSQTLPELPTLNPRDDG